MNLEKIASIVAEKMFGTDNWPKWYRTASKEDLKLFKIGIELFKAGWLKGKRDELNTLETSAKYLAKIIDIYEKEMQKP